VRSFPPGITITFEEPEDLLQVLTSERVRLLRRVKGQPQQISALVLLKTSYTSNPGHARLKLVESVAQQFKLVATL
jgi:hypothetical protein